MLSLTINIYLLNSFILKGWSWNFIYTVFFYCGLFLLTPFIHMKYYCIWCEEYSIFVDNSISVICDMFCLNNSFGILNLKKISTIHLGVKLYLLLLICFNQSERANISRDVYLAPPQNPSPFTLHHIHCSGNNSCKYFVLVVFWFYQYLVVCICSIWIIHFKLGFFQYLVVCICCM